MSVVPSVRRPVIPPVIDPVVRGGGLPWEGAQGGGALPDPIRDTVLALAFNGSSLTGTTSNTDAGVDELDLTAAVAFSSATNKRSISFWFLPIHVTTSVDECIIAHWDWGAAQAGWAVMLSGASANKIRVRTGPTTGADTITGTCTTDGTPITPAAWNHVLVVYDGAGASQALRCLIYVNGVLAASTNSGVPATLVTSSTSKLRAGRWNGVATATALPCPMLLRDVRIWGGNALSAGDAATLYAGGTPATVAVSTWPLNGDLEDTITTNDGTGTPAAPAGPHFASRTQTWPKPGTFKLLAIGDSNTAGSGFVGAWRREFVAYLWHQHGKKVAIGNLYTDAGTPALFLARYPRHSGLSGKKIGATVTAGNMRGDTPADIAAYAPNGIIIMGGTNDISADAQTGAQALTRLEALIDEIRAITAVPIWICSILPRNDADNADNVNFNAGLAALAATKADCVAIEAGTQESVRGLQADGVHAADIGHRKMGAAIAAAVQATVPA